VDDIVRMQVVKNLKNLPGQLCNHRLRQPVFPPDQIQ
jgi:hypothetical protein